MEVQVATITVSNLNKSRIFYESILGFIFNGFYEPSKWVQYKFETDTIFAIQEQKGYKRFQSFDEIDFYTKDVEKLWDQISKNTSVNVVQKLKKTDWGSYKFVIQDPDGFLLGFVQK